MLTALLADYLQQEADVPIQFFDSLDSNAHYLALAEGKVDIAWSCGLPYTLFADQPTPSIELLAAPIHSAPRYQGKAIYFSDLIVRADSPIQIFEELRGSRWAYNEIESFSGYRLMLAHLVEQGEDADFFADAVASGGHAQSLQAVLEGSVETAAIDSTYLDWQLEENPTLHSQIRVIDIIGPNPTPPWVIRRAVPQAIRERIRATLLSLHQSDLGRALLAMSALDSFVLVEDSAYNRIRQVARLSEKM